MDSTATGETKKAACYAHIGQTPDSYYALQDTVATFRGLQSGSAKAEGYIMQIGGPYDIFPRAHLTIARKNSFKVGVGGDRLYTGNWPLRTRTEVGDQP